MTEMANKQVALDWLRACLLVDKDRLFELTADDCEFFLTGEMPTSGWRTREQWIDGWLRVADALPAPFKVTVGAVTAEDDRVAVEAESVCRLANGKLYHNHYHFLFRVADGKVRTFKEYYDTQHVANVFEVPADPVNRESNLDSFIEQYERS